MTCRRVKLQMLLDLNSGPIFEQFFVEFNVMFNERNCFSFLQGPVVSKAFSLNGG